MTSDKSQKNKRACICASSIALLGAWDEGGLSSRRRRRIAHHLAACAACARQLENIRRGKRAAMGLRQHLAQMPQAAGAAANLAQARAQALTNRVQVRGRQERGKRSRAGKRFALRPVMPLIATTLLALALIVPLAWRFVPRPWAAKAAPSAREDAQQLMSTTQSGRTDAPNESAAGVSDRRDALDPGTAVAALRRAGISALPFVAAREGVCTLAVQLGDARDASLAQVILVDWVQQTAAGCTKADEIEIIHGEAPAIFTESPVSQTYKDARASLVAHITSAHVDLAGPWLILMWQVED